MVQDVKIFDKAIIAALFDDAKQRETVKAVAAFLQPRNGAEGRVGALGLEELVRVGEVSASVLEHTTPGPHKTPITDAAAKLLRANGSKVWEIKDTHARQAAISEALRPEQAKVSEWVSAFVSAADKEMELAAQGQSASKFTARV